MKYLNEHFKLVEEKLGFPKEAVELFESIALKIEKSKSFSEKFQKTLDKYLLPEAHDFGGMCDDMKKLTAIIPPVELQNKFLAIAKQSDKSKFVVSNRNLSR